MQGLEAQMVELLKAIFDQIAKRNWLRMIHKEVDRYYHIKNKLDTQAYIVNTLLKQYKEIYGKDLRPINKGMKS